MVIMGMNLVEAIRRHTSGYMDGAVVIGSVAPLVAAYEVHLSFRETQATSHHSRLPSSHRFADSLWL